MSFGLFLCLICAFGSVFLVLRSLRDRVDELEDKVEELKQKIEHN